MPILTELKRLFGLGVPAAQPPAETPLPDPHPVPIRAGGPSTPRQREKLYRFIVENLAVYANETEGMPAGLKLWVCCLDLAEEEQMAVALYANQPGHFQAELSRHLADHYIRFAPNWQFSWEFVRDTLPATCTYRRENLGLTVLRPDQDQPLRVRIRTLTGQTHEASYLLDPAVQTDYQIGRCQTVQAASGRMRTNHIAFLDADESGFDPERGEPNLSVSRQHATIHYDANKRQYRLLADVGGLPGSNNKTKIIRADDTVERVALPGVGYALAPGDQIELGGEANLLVESV
jgi:hypothetical protein